MKKIFPLWALTALMVATGVVQAQGEYHPVTDGCTWSVSNEKYMTAGDTVLDGKAYLKIYRQESNQPFEFDMGNAEFFAAIRNDTAERKVYAYVPPGSRIYPCFYNSEHYTIDSGMEVLIFDFTLQLGDTITYYTICPASKAAVAYFGYRSESASEVVADNYQLGFWDADSLIMMSDGTTRHRILLEAENIAATGSEIWMEGIGSLRGFNDPRYFICESPIKSLLCYHESAGTYFQTGYDLDNDPEDCFSNGFGGDVPERTTDCVSVYPNPADNLLHIELSGTEIRSMVLYDLQGRVVGANDYSPLQGGTTTLNLRNLPAGVYLLRVTDSEGKEYERKVVRN